MPRSRLAELNRQALRSHVANEQQLLVVVEAGKQALRDGRVIDHQTVVTAFERLVTPNL